MALQIVFIGMLVRKCHRASSTVIAHMGINVFIEIPVPIVCVPILSVQHLSISSSLPLPVSIAISSLPALLSGWSYAANAFAQRSPVAICKPAQRIVFIQVNGEAETDHRLFIGFLQRGKRVRSTHLRLHGRSRSLPRVSCGQRFRWRHGHTPYQPDAGLVPDSDGRRAAPPFPCAPPPLSSGNPAKGRCLHGADDWSTCTPRDLQYPGVSACIRMVAPLQISFPVPDRVQWQADGSCPFNLIFPDILHGDLVADFRSISLAELLIALHSRVIR